MNRTITVILCLCFFSSYSFGQNKLADIKIKADELSSMYKRLRSDHNVVNEKAFFLAFPSSFWLLNNIYGYTDTAGILYKYGVKHVNAFFDTRNAIGDSIFYKKVIDIAINGKWDADAVNVFHEDLVSAVNQKPELIVYLLKAYSKLDIESFWRFYFDKPHPAKDIDPSLETIKGLDSQIYQVILQAHERAISIPE